MRKYFFKGKFDISNFICLLLEKNSNFVIDITSNCDFDLYIKKTSEYQSFY